MAARRPTKRAATSRVPARRPAARAAPTRPAVGGSLVEPPHGHIVCRRCGRIAPLELPPEDSRALIELSGRGPRGWTVERIAYSLAAVCPSCATTEPK